MSFGTNCPDFASPEIKEAWADFDRQKRERDSMRSPTEISYIIAIAKQNNADKVEIDGVVYHIPLTVTRPDPLDGPTEEQIRSIFTVENEYTDEEMLYYATPYFDYLQAQKALRSQTSKDDLNGKE